jgi:drug/metabolite transporter (DMT)-like permease
VTCSFSPHVTIIGLLVMLLTTSFEAVRMVLTQYLLKDLKLGVVESQYFLSSSTAMCLFTASALTEIPQMIQARGFYILYEQFGVFALAASLGILVNYLTYFVIQLTSSLNLKILGMFRNILLIMVSIFMYQEKVTTNEIIGYGVALIGFIW